MFLIHHFHFPTSCNFRSIQFYRSERKIVGAEDGERRRGGEELLPLCLVERNRKDEGSGFEIINYLLRCSRSVKCTGEVVVISSSHDKAFSTDLNESLDLR